MFLSRRRAVGALLVVAVSLSLFAGFRAARRSGADPGDLDAVRRRGVLRVGTSGDYAPFSLAEGGRTDGLDVELLSRAARDLGVRIEFVHFSWPDLLRDLKTERFDVGASGITLRAERALGARFTRPYATTSAVLLAHREAVERLKEPMAFDRADVRITVNRGGHLERVARRLFSHATLLPLDDNRALLDPVLAAKADAALSDSAEAHRLGHPELLRLGPLTRDHKALLVSARAPALAAWLDEWLRAREKDGFVAALRKRHLGDESSATDMAAEAAVADVDLRTALMPLVAAAKARKGLAIEDRDQEARVLERVAHGATTAGIPVADTRALYELLMRASKEVQRASSTTPESAVTAGPAPELDELRDAIRRVDEHLLHSLRDVQQAHARPDFPALVQAIDIGGLGAGTRAEIGASLARFAAAP